METMTTRASASDLELVNALMPQRGGEFARQTVAVARPFVCRFRPCGNRMDAEHAYVPALPRIFAITGKLTQVADLADHAVCGKHAHEGRKAGFEYIRYSSAVSIICAGEARRAAEREARNSFFAQYGKPAVKRVDPFNRLAAEQREARRHQPRGH